MIERIMWGALATAAGYSFVKWAMLRKYDNVYRACGL